MSANPSSTSANPGDQRPQLDALEFSEPRCRYESTAVYKNPDTGQVFKIVARGLEQESVANFMRQLKVRLEVKPGDAAPPPDVGQVPTYQVDQLQASQKQEKPTEEPAVACEIEVVDSGDIQPPFIVDFQIDPSINRANQLAPQGFDFYSTTWIRVTIHADEGSMDASLENGVSKFTSVDAEGLTMDTLSGSSGDPTTFFLYIDGEGQFDLSGQYSTSSSSSGHH